MPSLEKSRCFFTETLGHEQVGEVPDYPAAFLTDGKLMITLWQAVDPDQATPFWWDANGDCLLYKRLHRAVFVLPGSPGGRPVRIDGSEFSKVIAGVARERRQEGT